VRSGDRAPFPAARGPNTQAVTPRPVARLLAAALAAGLVGGCGASYAPPLVGAEDVQAARRSIAAAPPLVSNGRPTGASAAMLDTVARRMAAAAQPLCAAHRRAPCDFQVSLDPSTDLRAEAFGQGRVTVSAGMMAVLDNEDEVAAVVGHELGHHLAGHLDRQVARGVAAGTAASTLLGAVVPFGGLAAWALGQGAAELGAGATRLAFSKEDEREADYLDAYLVARAGYDLDRASQVWVKLARHDPQESAGPLDSHPAGPDRLAAWRRAAEEIRASPDLVPRQSGS
jgi:predicted Zn-dependent protease